MCVCVCEFVVLSWALSISQMPEPHVRIATCRLLHSLQIEVFKTKNLFTISASQNRCFQRRLFAMFYVRLLFEHICKMKRSQCMFVCNSIDWRICQHECCLWVRIPGCTFRNRMCGNQKRKWAFSDEVTSHWFPSFGHVRLCISNWQNGWNG